MRLAWPIVDPLSLRWRQVAVKPGCHFPRGPSAFSWHDWESWYFLRVPRAQDASQVLALDARVKAVDGDAQTALQDVQAILGMARHASVLTAPTCENWRQLQRSLDGRTGGLMSILSMQPEIELTTLQDGLMYMLYMQPKIEGTAQRACDVATLRRLCRLAVALASYKAKNGKYADKLEELMPDFLDRVPDDPWDGGKLHIKRTEEGIVLFTFRNQTDNPILSPNGAGQRRDVVLRLP